MSESKHSPNLTLVVEQWTESLAQVIESMTDQRPEVRSRLLSGAEESGMPAGLSSADMLWWEQPFHLGADAVAWVGAPQTTWEYAGSLTLKAAGLENVEITEARNTWLEILGQSLSSMGRSIGAVLGREITCEAGVERQPGAQAQEWVSVSLNVADAALAPLLLAFSPKLVGIIHTPPPASVQIEEEPLAPRFDPPPDAPSRTMELLLDIELPVSISFGRAQLPLKDVLKLTTGSIVELNRAVNDQVEVLVNQCLIARGEVVVVEGNYGVRIMEIASRHERLRSLR